MISGMAAGLGGLGDASRVDRGEGGTPTYRLPRLFWADILMGWEGGDRPVGDRAAADDLMGMGAD